MDLTIISACMQMEFCRKIDNDKISSHTHNTEDILSWKPFQEKTQLEGEAVSLSFFV